MKENNELKATEYRNYYNHKDAGHSFLWAVIAPYIISFFILFVGYSIYSAKGWDAKLITTSLWFNIVIAIVTPLTFLVVFLIYNRSKKISFSASKVKFKLNIATIMILILISIVCVFGLQYLITGIDVGIESIGYNLSTTALPLDNGWWYVLNLFVLAFLPAVCEELIFRGIIFNGLRRNMKDGYAILLSAGLFALMHASLQQLLYPFLLGLVFSWLVLRTKTIISSMIVHFMNNAIVVTISFVYNMTGFNFMPSTTWVFWLLAGILPFVVFGILFLLDRFYFKRKSKDEKIQEIPQEENNLQRFPSIIMIVGIVIAVVLFVVNTALAFK